MLDCCNVYASCQRTEEEEAQTLLPQLKKNWNSEEQLMAWQNTAFDAVTHTSICGWTFFLFFPLYLLFFSFLRKPCPAKHCMAGLAQGSAGDEESPSVGG